jgi:hypothetical protein
VALRDTAILAAVRLGLAPGEIDRNGAGIRAAAALVIVKPKGSIHWRSTTPPGWSGFFIATGFSFEW